MPLPEDFAHECLYKPEAWFVHDVDFADDRRSLVAQCDTTQLGYLVDAQQTWPGHPKHFPAAVAVQITGVLGQLAAVYMLGMRASEGWVGFGTHIHHARFPRMGVIGPGVSCHLEVLKDRNFQGTRFTRFGFRYVQGEHAIYESEQTAAWVMGEAHLKG